MILTRNYRDINTVYDFYEGIITNIRLDGNLVDLLVTVYYAFDEPEGCRDKNLVIRFRNCVEIRLDCMRAIASMKTCNLERIFTEIESVAIEPAGTALHVAVASNFTDRMIALTCDEIWIETSEEA